MANAEAFEAASNAVIAATSAKPDLTTVWGVGSEEGLWICGPSGYPDLAYFAELGVNFLEVGGGTGIDQVSWEQVGNYSPDVFFYDVRETGAFYTLDQVKEQPVVAQLPAIQAGQIGNWYYEYVFSRAGFTFVLNDLAETLEKSEIVTG